ncbi:MAG: thioredoxin domain-containing protein [Patescibacteria group bacterium]|nr:thioredoxin domain-containing protein [Patescibacteria group bacterium]
MKNIFLTALMLLSVALLIPSAVSAHPGSTDSKGGHYCTTNCDSYGLYQNEYHYHNANGTSVFTYDNNKAYYDQALSERLKGRILLQVEDHGEAWYIRKEDGMRYYMPDGDAAYEMMRYFSLGISNADLDKIPKVSDSQAMNKSTSICKYNALANRLKGEILLQVDNHGEAYYVDPVKCRAIYMKDGAAAYQIMRYLGLGAINDDIEKIVLGMSDSILEHILAVEVPAPKEEPAQPSVPVVNASRDHILGSENAIITMIEYSDFECPFCARHQETMDIIKELYPNDVRIVFRHFPLSFHAHAQKAAEASECAADQNKFWEMHDKIFELSKSGNMSIDNFKLSATQLGLNRGQFDPCLDSGIKASRVTEDQNQGMVAGVQGTPATFINGELVSGALPLDSFLDILNQLGAEN